MMINGPDNSERLLNILKKADFAQINCCDESDLRDLLISFNSVLASDPALIDKLICEGLNINAHHFASILSWIAPSYLIKNLAKFKLSDFMTIVENGESALYHLVTSLHEDSQDALMAVLNQFKDQLTAADFTACAQDGPNKGQSMLWWLASATAYGTLEALMTVLNQFKDQLTAADFTTCAQDGLFRGQSVLCLLAITAANRRPEALMSVLNLFKGQLTAADFTACAQDGPNKGKSALWWLGNAAAHRRPEALMAVLNQFKDQFTAADFTTCVQDGLYRGQSALWWLVVAAANDKPEALMTVLNQFKDQLTAADFTTFVQDGPFSRCQRSALWMLAFAANDKPEALMTVLNQFKDQLTAADFTAVVQDDQWESHSVLSLLARAAASGNSIPLTIVLTHIAFDTQTLTNLSKEKLPEQVQILVITRIYLANLLGRGCTSEESLFSAAKAVKLAGYAEAYYDLGKYFEKMNMQKQAVRSFLELREDSYYVEPICNEYSTRLIGMATEASDSHGKYQHLATALKFALKIENDENRHTTLQTIARLYINQTLRNSTDVGSAAIPPHLLEVMHGQIDSSWCFKVFQQLAETVQLKLSNKKLTEKLEKSKTKRALEQETRQLLAPIKELLTHFENEKRQAAEKTKKARPNEAEDHHDLCLDTDGPKEALSKMISIQKT